MNWLWFCSIYADSGLTLHKCDINTRVADPDEIDPESGSDLDKKNYLDQTVKKTVSGSGPWKTTRIKSDDFESNFSGRIRIRLI